MTESAVTNQKTAEPAQVIDRYVAAYNNADADELAAVHHPDVKILDGGEVRVGNRDDLMELVVKRQFANNGSLEVLSRMFSGQWVIDQQIMHGTQRGDLRLAVGYRVRDGVIDLAVYMDPEP